MCYIYSIYWYGRFVNRKNEKSRENDDFYGDEDKYHISPVFINLSRSVIIHLTNGRYNLAIVRGKGFPKTIRRVP